MSKAKHTNTPWVADLRNGCCAIYHESSKGDTNGCHSYDERNIIFSMKGAKVDEKQGWIMDEETQANFQRIVHCVNHFEQLKRSLTRTRNMLIDVCPTELVGDKALISILDESDEALNL